MHRYLLAAIASILAISALSMPADARVSTTRSGAWHIMVSDQARATRTLIDRTPLVTYVAIFLQKKAGPTSCRATVTVTKSGHTWKWRNLQKWTRNYAKYGVWKVSPSVRDRTVVVRANTNGRCIVGVGVR